ncbi:DUF4255 domain-containing protein [Larkinella punicea]|uniref:DUF4255 domain-containing protein n=1 Tax=Larkinella punicea TaxID=2315727 RepID=A0A368JTF3_9BACT|nr:DUF4255 domain-containing protein [Larkinella punicea]RCR69471.1 DUF4255 domain-containing protein [Larkinella punicea]
MVYEALELIRSELETYVKPLADGITVNLGSIAAVAGTQANTILIGLVHLEEEATLKNTSPYQRNSTTGGFDVRNPPVFLNLYVLISANYAGSGDYETALKLLSRTVQCFQQKNQFTIANTLTDKIFDDAQALMLRMTVELYSLSFEKLNQLWGTLGGKQVPSVVYKVRVVEEQAEGQLGAGTQILSIEGIRKPIPIASE